MTKLKPCPFCGGEVLLNIIESHMHQMATFMPGYSGGVFIECPGCTCAISGETVEDATTAWNRRAPEPKAKPLTIEKLQSLETLEWVWIEVIHPTETYESGYKRKQADYTRGRAFCCGWPGCGFHYGYDDYGETWFAYDKPPKELQT